VDKKTCAAHWDHHALHDDAKSSSAVGYGIFYQPDHLGGLHIRMSSQVTSRPGQFPDDTVDSGPTPPVPDHPFLVNGPFLNRAFSIRSIRQERSPQRRVVISIRRRRAAVPQ